MPNLFASLKNHKTCSQCTNTKPIKDFHSDRSAKDMYASSCKECRNAKRNNAGKKAPGKVLRKAAVIVVKQESNAAKGPQKKPHTTHSIPIHEEGSIDTLFKNVMACHRAHFAISMDKKGLVRLQIHTNATQTFIGMSVEKLLKDAAKDLAISLASSRDENGNG